MDDSLRFVAVTNLKKCPWCGSNGKLFVKSFDKPCINYEGRECLKYHVECVNPDCKAKAPHPYSNDIFRSSEEAALMAAAFWNERAKGE